MESNIFLDEKLYSFLHENEQLSHSEILVGLYKVCEDHYIPQIKKQMSYREVSDILDRVFGQWDLFMKKLSKENNRFYHFLEERPFKKALLMNEEIKNIYLMGK